MTRQTEYPVNPQFTDRWSPRALSGEALPLDTLMSFFEAARWAPSSSNVQPWRFVYGLAGTPGFDAIFASLVQFNKDWAKNASALVAVISAKNWPAREGFEPKPFGSHSFDTGSAWMSLALQAHHAGWVAHAMGGFDAAVLAQALGVPADYAIEAVVALGKQTDKSVLPQALQEREEPSPRKPMAEIVAEGKFSF